MPEVPFRKLFLFLVPIILQGSVWGSPSCASEREYQLREGRCCSKCPPGHYMVNRCTPIKDTECRPCREGVAYNANWNTRYQCQPCRQCVGVLAYRSTCSLTADAVCTCRAGLFCATEDCLLCLSPLARDSALKKPYARPSRRQSRKLKSTKTLRPPKKKGKHRGSLRKRQIQQQLHLSTL
ncbi:CD27 antigen isoform X1 [Pleurodeles waltl]|uniref:CD27 antigen isoform X1 n=1 Tax=Pleurodeles waltl TaxID=8319 RepID=UPI003709BED4